MIFSFQVLKWLKVAKHESLIYGLTKELKDAFAVNSY